MKNYISVVTYANLTILLVNVHIDSGYLVVVTKLIENETGSNAREERDATHVCRFADSAGVWHGAQQLE